MEIRNVTAELWTLPLHAPFAISQRIAYTAENVFIFVEASDGDESIVGYGASAPVAYVTGETTESVQNAVRSVAEVLTGQKLDRLNPLLSVISEELADSPAARAGIEMAIYDAWAKLHRISLWQHFGAARNGVATDMTIPITSAEAAATLAQAASASGFSTLKIKVGAHEGPDADFDRIRAVVDAVPRVRLRIDANQAFTPEGAIEFAGRLHAFNATVELIEQPVSHDDTDGLKAVRDAIAYPVFADEAARSPKHVWDLINRDAVDGVNIKLMKSGITGALQIIDLCRVAGKKLMIGCMLETELGIAAATQIAAGTGAFDHVDLDSHHLLAPVPQVSGGLKHCGENLTIAHKSGTYGWGVTVEKHVHSV
jgi:L-alanine-DL-glutamate epimerase-like enolase superfamily enzyme